VVEEERGMVRVGVVEVEEVEVGEKVEVVEEVEKKEKKKWEQKVQGMERGIETVISPPKSEVGDGVKRDGDECLGGLVEEEEVTAWKVRS
jgi:hypothetical protein